MVFHNHPALLESQLSQDLIDDAGSKRIGVVMKKDEEKHWCQLRFLPIDNGRPFLHKKLHAL